MMADSKRKQILQNLVTTLEAVQSLGAVGLGSYEPLNQNRPVAGVLPEIEETRHEPDRNYLETLNVTVRVVVDQSNAAAGWELEDVLADVHRAVLADLTRGGLAHNTLKLGTRWLFLDQEHPRAGADLRFQIEFQTEEQDPSN